MTRVPSLVVALMVTLCLVASVAQAQCLIASPPPGPVTPTTGSIPGCPSCSGSVFCPAYVDITPNLTTPLAQGETEVVGVAPSLPCGAAFACFVIQCDRMTGGLSHPPHLRVQVGSSILYPWQTFFTGQAIQVIVARFFAPTQAIPDTAPPGGTCFNLTSLAALPNFRCASAPVTYTIAAPAVYRFGFGSGASLSFDNVPTPGTTINGTISSSSNSAGTYAIFDGTPICSGTLIAPGLVLYIAPTVPLSPPLFTGTLNGTGQATFPVQIPSLPHGLTISIQGVTLTPSATGLTDALLVGT